MRMILTAVKGSPGDSVQDAWVHSSLVLVLVFWQDYFVLERSRDWIALRHNATIVLFLLFPLSCTFTDLGIGIGIAVKRKALEADERALIVLLMHANDTP
jgi:hypothetical protein